jgi:hypothetical protein
VVRGKSRTGPLLRALTAARAGPLATPDRERPREVDH